MSDQTRGLRWKDNIITRKEKTSPNLFNKFCKVVVTGKIEKELEYSHELRGEKFYRTRVRVMRVSGTEDLVPLIISEFLIGENMIKLLVKDELVEVAGHLRSYQVWGNDGCKHKLLSLYVTEVNFYDNEVNPEISNLIYLEGYICKQPIYRNLYLSRRQITELMIAVKRSYNILDYLPCVTWGEVAQWTRNLEVGKRVELYGRIQSRKYFKRYSPDSDEGEYRETYEISVRVMQEVDD